MDHVLACLLYHAWCNTFWDHHFYFLKKRIKFNSGVWWHYTFFTCCFKPPLCKPLVGVEKKQKIKIKCEYPGRKRVFSANQTEMWTVLLWVSKQGGPAAPRWTEAVVFVTALSILTIIWVIRSSGQLGEPHEDSEPLITQTSKTKVLKFTRAKFHLHQCFLPIISVSFVRSEFT